jgi:hypothetical protein
MQTPASAMPFVARPSARVGVSAGLLAGLVYLAGQIILSLLLGQDPWAPLRRIEAIVTGPHAVAATDESLAAVAGLALVVHLALSATYGRVVDVLVMNLGQRVVAGLAGAVFGALLYVANHWIIAPVLFPWFEASRDIATALDHVMFGLVAALACHSLRRRRGWA